MTSTFAPPGKPNAPTRLAMSRRFFRKAGFEKVDAYRYNSASIRVRVIDSKIRRDSRPISGMGWSSPASKSYRSAPGRTS